MLARTSSADEKPLDVREPPFGFGDFSWTDGNNSQPASLLTAGPVTGVLYLDGYYLYQFNHPIDHTAFPSVVAPRHDEVSVNMAMVGVDVTGLDGPIGRLFLQYAAASETLGGQDPTTARGFYLSQRAFQYLQQAALGWHFHVLHGANVEAGIMPSPIGLQTVLPEENWTYLRPFASDFTPYYLSGVRGQLFPTDHLKLEAWLANGWQTFGKWHEGPAFVYAAELRPSERVELHGDGYVGRDQQTDDGAVRNYWNAYGQWQPFKRSSGVPRSVALAVGADFGYETHTGSRDGVFAAGSASTRVQWTPQWMTTLRADTFYDSTKSLVTTLPSATGYALPDKPDFLGDGFTATLDFWPSPWILYRVEYMHRQASIPYFSGPGGITPPSGLSSSMGSAFSPDLRRSDDRVVINVTLRL